jgi:nitrate/TMAO reductase-like tetraheme cytochrome c subunit
MKQMSLLPILLVFLQCSALGEETTPDYLISNTPIRLLPRKAVPDADQCRDCHQKKSKAVFPRKGRPVKEHGEIPSRHGGKEVSCHNCHDPVNSNLLRITEVPAPTFRDSSPVCSTCHARTFESWRRGLHGKRQSGSGGVREQLHCIDCHPPHSVTYPKTKALPPPQKPRNLIEVHR